MANDCGNYTVVTGPIKDLKSFSEKIGIPEVGKPVEKFSFARALMPCPQELLDTVARIYSDDFPEKLKFRLDSGKISQERYWEEFNEWQSDNAKHNYNLGVYGATDWCQWAYDHWGTKWGDYEHQEYFGTDDCIVLNYQTAWGPFHEDFWATVSKDWPTLTFVTEYDEPNMAFYGVIAARDGATVSTVREYPEMDENADDSAWDALREQIEENLTDIAANAADALGLLRNA
jgi:hypothetical protein